MPRIPVRDPARTDAAGLGDEADIVAGWGNVLASTDRRQPPLGILLARWAQLLDDTKRFLTEWGPRAVALGWTADDLFGCHCEALEARYDSAGLV